MYFHQPGWIWALCLLIYAPGLSLFGTEHCRCKHTQLWTLSLYHSGNGYPTSQCLCYSLSYTFASINNTARAECFKAFYKCYSNCRCPSGTCLFCWVLLCQYKWIPDIVGTSKVHRHESKVNTEFTKAERKWIFNIIKSLRLLHKMMAVL